jgi:diacylglycerol kinase family enzyme
VGTSGITHLSETDRITVEPGNGPMVLAVDGEVMPGVRSVEFTVRRDALTYYSPLG